MQRRGLGSENGALVASRPRRVRARHVLSGRSSLAVLLGIAAAALGASAVPAQAGEGAAITGRVLAKGSSTPIEGIEVCAAEDAPPYREGCARSGTAGAYTIADLAPGSYSVSFFPPTGSPLNYLGEYYSSPVAVAANSTTEHIETELEPGAEVSGAVSAAGSNTALADIEVCAYVAGADEYEGFFSGCATTSEDGGYTLPGLPTGSYELVFRTPFESTLNYAPTYYPGKPTRGEAEPVSLTAGAVKPGVNVTMSAGGELKGRATSAQGGGPIAGLEACAYGEGTEGRSCALTDAAGDYVITGLATGSYRLWFSVPSKSTLSFLEQEYDHGAAVKVSAGGETTGLNVSMEPGGSIAGQVTSATAPGGIAEVEVCAGPACTETDAEGNYTLTSLEPSQYQVSFRPGGYEYAAQYYPGKVYASEAQLVTVKAGATASAIDATLAPGSTIKGTVTSAATTLPLAGASVCRYATGEESYGFCEATNSAGEYAFYGLAATSYKLSFGAAGNFLPTYYNGKSSLASADRVTLAPGETRSLLNTALATGGSITGQVLDAGAKDAIKGIEVCASGAGILTRPCGVTSSSGRYTIEGLPSGEYTVYFFTPYESSLNYLPQYFDGAESQAQATRVAVTAGDATERVDAAMSPGAEISGQVKRAGDGTAVANAFVELYAQGLAYVSRTTTTAQDGSYSFKGLPAGEYKVFFSPPSGSDLETQYYNGQETLAQANAITVATAGSATGVDAALRPDGAISGHVTRSDSKAPLAEIHVCVYQGYSQLYGACTVTDQDGAYEIQGLAAGHYSVEFYSGTAGFVTQYFSGKATLGEATTITVTSGKTSENVDAALEPSGTIAGTVTAAAGETGLSGVQVCAEGVSSGYRSGCAETTEGGAYEITGLTPGSYRVDFLPAQDANYLGQYYNSKSTRAEAVAVTVHSGATTEAIDARLAAGGELAGVVTGARDGAPLTEATVCARGPALEGERCGQTGTSGAYRIAGLPAGEYIVEVIASTPQGEVEGYYPGVPEEEEATAVVLAQGASKEGIDISLHLDGAISGQVTEAGTGKPLYGVRECITERSGNESFGCTESGSSGEYTFTELPAGSYIVQFVPGYSSPGFESQYYNGAGTQSEATAVVVEEGLDELEDRCGDGRPWLDLRQDHDERGAPNRSRT